MNVKPGLGILARRTELQQIKDGLNVPVETIVALAGESHVTAVEAGDRFLSVAIQVARRSHTRFGWVLAVVPLIVERGRDALVVRRHGPRSQDGPAASMMVHLGHSISLGQVLRSVTDMIHD